jgi:hypothetical protein
MVPTNRSDVPEYVSPVDSVGHRYGSFRVHRDYLLSNFWRYHRLSICRILLLFQQLVVFPVGIIPSSHLSIIRMINSWLCAWVLPKRDHGSLFHEYRLAPSLLVWFLLAIDRVCSPLFLTSRFYVVSCYWQRALFHGSRIVPPVYCQAAFFRYWTSLESLSVILFYDCQNDTFDDLIPNFVLSSGRQSMFNSSKWLIALWIWSSHQDLSR